MVTLLLVALDGQIEKADHGSCAARHCGNRPRNPISTFLRIATGPGWDGGCGFTLNAASAKDQGLGSGIWPQIKMQRASSADPYSAGVASPAGPLLRSPAPDGMSGCRSVRFSFSLELRPGSFDLDGHGKMERVGGSQTVSSPVASVLDW